jgi:hypothetical protein
MFIPDPDQSFSIPDPGSTSKNFSIITQKMFLSSRKYDPSCSSRIRILTFDPSQTQRPKKAPDPGSTTPHFDPTLGLTCVGLDVALALWLEHLEPLLLLLLVRVAPEVARLRL